MTPKNWTFRKSIRNENKTIILSQIKRICFNEHFESQILFSISPWSFLPNTFCFFFIFPILRGPEVNLSFECDEHCSIISFEHHTIDINIIIHRALYNKMTTKQSRISCMVSITYKLLHQLVFQTLIKLRRLKFE